MPQKRPLSIKQTPVRCAGLEESVEELSVHVVQLVIVTLPRWWLKAFLRQILLQGSPRAVQTAD